MRNLLMDAARIVERTTALLTANGRYADMWAMRQQTTSRQFWMKSASSL
jgi:ABC-type multidrug transport system fused ATPase/permease subunit